MLRIVDRYWWLLLLGALLAAFVAAGAWKSFTRSDHLPDVTRDPQLTMGEALYQQRCAACHGARLEGHANWKQRLPSGRLPAPPHDASGHTWHHSDEQLFRLTKEGVSGILPNYESDMPAYKDVLTDEEIRAVLAFIESRWPKDIQAARRRQFGPRD